LTASFAEEIGGVQVIDSFGVRTVLEDEEFGPGIDMRCLREMRVGVFKVLWSPTLPR